MNYEMIISPYAYLETKEMQTKRLQCIHPNEKI